MVGFFIFIFHFSCHSSKINTVNDRYLYLSTTLRTFGGIESLTVPVICIAFFYCCTNSVQQASATRHLRTIQYRLRCDAVSKRKYVISSDPIETFGIVMKLWVCIICKRAVNKKIQISVTQSNKQAAKLDLNRSHYFT